MNKHQLEKNYIAVKSEIEKACLESSRNPSEVTLVAVSKKKPPEYIAALYKFGHRDFGENYLQELQEKREFLKGFSDIRWHFVGRLQSNKLVKVVQSADVVHACDKLEYLVKIDGYAKSLNKEMQAFIAIKLEEQKSGISLNELDDFNEKAKLLEHVDVKGLMSIPPLTFNDDNYQEPPLEYLQLKKYVDQYGFEDLSLGMSADLSIAIRAGSTHVRIGQALFGARSDD